LTQIVEKNAVGTVINQSNQTYDPNDLRIGMTANGATERYVYGQNQNIGLQFNGSGALTNRYLHGNSIDAILADESNGSTLWTFTDHQNSVRDLGDDSGVVRNHLTYSAFGELTSQSDPSVTTQFGYTGREFEPATGLQYNRGRFYAPFTGKFLSPDPIGFDSGDVNLYRYVSNRPITDVDPSGQYGKLNSFNRSGNYVTAEIGWEFGYKNERREPKDGLLTDKKLSSYGVTLTGRRYRTEDMGHLVPALLGGSEFNKMQDPRDNFISQDPIMNQEPYNRFSKRVNERFKDYYKAYREECRKRGEFRRENSIRILGLPNPFCDCEYPWPKNPNEPTLTYRVGLVMPQPNTQYLESKFPNRPEKINVSVTFNRNSLLSMSNEYKSLPDIATTTAEFTNYINFVGANPRRFTKRPNTYKLKQNDARIGNF
jgi:RHS repeat-associated protein